MKCAKCGTENAPNSVSCSGCGRFLGLACASCGADNPPGFLYCGRCGGRLAVDKRRMPEPSEEAPETPSPGRRLGDRFTTGERREATVLFADLSGYVSLSARVDPEQVQETFGRIKTQAIQIVERHGGIVNQFIGDEVVALFGTPTTHEDDPVRGVRAALALHEMVRDLSTEVESRLGQPLRLHTGVNTGLIVAHAGDARDGRLEITGSTVNIASRLKLLAGHDEIVVGPDTQRLIADFIETEAMEPVVLKGFAQAIRPYRVSGVSDVQSRFEAAARKGLTPFTGRERERALLQSSLERALGGQGRIAAVTGDPGMGKSRIMYEFRASLKRDTAILYEGRCQPYGVATPYLPFLNALRQALRLEQDDSVETLREKVVRGIEGMDGRLRRYLPHYLHLLAIPHPDYALPEQEPDMEQIESLQVALVEGILAAGDRRPVVLILEDWHWSDEASQSTLARLASRLAGHPVLVVLLYRPSELQVRFAEGVEVTEVMLAPLNKQQTAGMIASMLSARSVPSALVDAVFERSAGNPLYTEELCRSLRDDGTLTVDDGALRLTRPLEAVNLPQSIQGVIRSRLDRLDPQTLATLRVASVIGRFFGWSLLQRLAPAGAPLTRCMAELTRHDLVQEVLPASELAYRFKHVLTQVVVYETLLLTQRQELHERVGAALAESHAERLEENLETLAFHYEKSGNAREAARYHTLAARKASRSYSFAVACQYYRMAFRRLSECDASAERDAAGVQIALQWSNSAQGEPAPELLDALRLSVERLGKGTDLKLLARVMRHAGWCHLILGNFRDALTVLEQSLRLSYGVDEGHAQMQAQNWLGRACWAAGRHPAAVRHLRAGLEQLERIEHPAESSLSHAYLALALCGMGRFAEARTHIERAMTLARSVGNKGCETFAQASAAVVEATLGNWDTAKRLVLDNVKPLQATGNSLPLATARVCLAEAEFHSGSRAAAVAQMAEAIENTVTKGTTYMYRYHADLAYCAARLGLDSQARRSLEQHALADLGRSRSAVCASWTQAWLAVRGATPDLAAAERHMAEAMAVATELELAPDVARSHFHFAELLAEAGQNAQAGKQLDHARTRFRELDMRWWIERVDDLQQQLSGSGTVKAERRARRPPVPPA